MKLPATIAKLPNIKMNYFPQGVSQYILESLHPLKLYFSHSQMKLLIRISILLDDTHGVNRIGFH